MIRKCKLIKWKGNGHLFYMQNIFQILTFNFIWQLYMFAIQGDIIYIPSRHFWACGGPTDELSVPDQVQFSIICKHTQCKQQHLCQVTV